MTPLEEQLGTALQQICDNCNSSTIGYHPNYLSRWLRTSNPTFRKTPVAIVRHLMLRSIDDPKSGFQQLRKAGKLEWTVEWLIAEDTKFHPLFQDSKWLIKTAKARIHKAEKAPRLES